MDHIKDIRKIVKEEKAIIGTKEVIKNLKLGKVKKVYVTSNCPDDVREDVDRYAKIAEAEVVELSIPNDELGVVCKKTFSISILGLGE